MFSCVRQICSLHFCWKVKRPNDDYKQFANFNKWFNSESITLADMDQHTPTCTHTPSLTHREIGSYSYPKQTTVKPLGHFSHTSNIKDSLQLYSVTLWLSVSPKRHKSCCFGNRGRSVFYMETYSKPPGHQYADVENRSFKLCMRTRRFNCFRFKRMHFITYSYPESIRSSLKWLQRNTAFKYFHNSPMTRNY